jgi:hypothetical protein
LGLVFSSYSSQLSPDRRLALARVKTCPRVDFSAEEGARNAASNFIDL